MDMYCSMHCGHFYDLDKAEFEKKETWLKEVFKFVEYDEEGSHLDVTGATKILHDPDVITEIFDNLASMLGEKSKGRIMLYCGSTEVCFFRKNKWKLMSLVVPEDPFDNVRYVKS